MNGPRLHWIGTEPTAAPPDKGLQAERTSLSWARTWAVVAANIILVAKLVGEMSWGWAAAFCTLAVVPLFALLRFQRRHEQRIGRFVRGDETKQTQALSNLGLVGVVILIVTCGFAALAIRAAP